ncbi:amidohydrolase family protein [Subtercola frigoramans]|uniref:L-fuconolactonase n=1 Tax=Subtercola frigoramans TaxID=120298 RepID=A0ABS2L1W6_9MICO|nr:amidohydrolase family protein [Subtercola frigoramans]MBM7470476.1 L-fuconolactonase [Subtercola frigoramans]
MRDTRIDAHLHVWDPGRVHYAWLGAQHAPIDRPMHFEDAAPLLARSGLDAAILVQSADNSADTEYMLDVAERWPRIVGVVGWIPLDQPEQAEHELNRLHRNELVVGIRNLIHDQEDADWLRRPEVMDGLRLLEASGTPFDLVAELPRHLQHVQWMSERFPALDIVIDHLGKPPIGRSDDTPEAWWRLLRDAAENPRVHAKVSGLYSAEGHTSAWTPEAVAPFFDRALEAFGAERLMFGGDWPVCELAGGYDRVWSALSSLIGELSPTEAGRMLGGTAAEFYTLDPARLERARLAQTAV